MIATELNRLIGRRDPYSQSFPPRDRFSNERGVIPAQARLKTAGAGFLAPVGSNASDAGRALNRRVELVAP
jgi:hypothetical protein